MRNLFGRCFCCSLLAEKNARIQLPASLRAVDSVADAFHVSASEVGSRVYGHRGGLTVRERYILAEKREAHLKQSREAGTDGVGLAAEG